MSLQDVSRFKRIEIYKSLVINNLLDDVRDNDIYRYGVTKKELLEDIDTNFSGIKEYGKTEVNNGKLEEDNKATGFVWTEHNIPLITPEYHVYDNSQEDSWEEHRANNVYPSPKDNDNNTTQTGADDFETYNNKKYGSYFEHTQGVIRPKKDQTLDAWYDVGLQSVIYQNGKPYSTSDFQKTFYVWYLKGDGSDYPYIGQFGACYPGQEYKFKYRYVGVERLQIPTAMMYKLKGDTPSFRYANGSDGFYIKLPDPDRYTNGLVKVDVNRMAETGQKWHYQGFSLKTFRIFSKYPQRAIELNMEGNKRTLDITKLIDVNLTWDFEYLRITSSNEDILTITHDWTEDENSVVHYTGPNEIVLTGGMDGTATVTIEAKPKNSTYKESIRFDVKVKQLFVNETIIKVSPNKLTTMEGVTRNFTVNTNATNYTVTTDSVGIIKLYKDRIEGIKPGTGIIKIKGQAKLAMPLEISVPFTVSKYLPDPTLVLSAATLTVTAGEVVSFDLNTLCPRGNVFIDIDDFDLIQVSDVKWKDRTTPNPDKRAKEYPTQYGTVDVLGLKEGKTSLYVSSYVDNGGVSIEKSIVVTVLPEPTEEEKLEEEVDPDGDKYADEMNPEEPRLATIGKQDTFIAFHQQHQGNFTYVISKKRKDDNSNKIYIVPEVSKELIQKNNGSTDFHLALIQDLTNTIMSLDKTTNPNYLDFKEDYDPMIGFAGSTAREENIYLNRRTLEVFYSRTVAGKRIWVGTKGTTIGDIFYPFPGEKGFGSGPCSQDIVLYYGLRPKVGCWDRNSDNYGHYYDYSGSELVYIPRHYLHFVYNGTELSRIDVYYPPAVNHLNYNSVCDFKDGEYIPEDYLRGRDGVITKDDPKFSSLVKQLVIPAAFVNNGKLLPGIFIDKYKVNISDNTMVAARNTRLNSTYHFKKYTAMKGVVHTDDEEYPPTSSVEFNFESDKLWSQLFATTNRRINISNCNDDKVSRVKERYSKLTTQVRGLLQYDSIAHATCCETFSLNNCKWLNTRSGTPLTRDMVNAVLSESDKQYANGCKYIDDLSQGATDSSLIPYTTHNGMGNGIAEVGGDSLEIAIGTHIILVPKIEYDTSTLKVFNNISQAFEDYSEGKHGAMPALDDIINDNGRYKISKRVTGFEMKLDTADKNTDFINLSKVWENEYSNSLTRTGSIPSNGKCYTGNDVEKLGLKSYLENFTSQDTVYYIKNNYNIGLASNAVKKDVKLNTLNTTGIYNAKLNLGMFGTNVLTETLKDSDNGKVLNLLDSSLNKNMELDYTFNNLNIGDNRSKFVLEIGNNINLTNVDPDTGFEYVLLPMYGAILSDRVKQVSGHNRIQFDSSNFNNITWYAVNRTDVNRYLTDEQGGSEDLPLELLISTRLIIIPNMEDVIDWVNNGGYEIEYRDDIDYWGSNTGDGSILHDNDFSDTMVEEDWDNDDQMTTPDADKDTNITKLSVDLTTREIFIVEEDSKTITIDTDATNYTAELTDINYKPTDLGLLTKEGNTITITGNRVGNGRITIKAKNGLKKEKKIILKVFVTAKPRLKLTVTPSTAEVEEGDTVEFAAVTDGSILRLVPTGKNITATSSKTESGFNIVVTGVGVGTDSLVITSEAPKKKSISATVNLTVTAKPYGVKDVPAGGSTTNWQGTGVMLKHYKPTANAPQMVNWFNKFPVARKNEIMTVTRNGVTYYANWILWNLNCSSDYHPMVLANQIATYGVSTGYGYGNTLECLILGENGWIPYNSNNTSEHRISAYDTVPYGWYETKLSNGEKVNKFIIVELNNVPSAANNWYHNYGVSNNTFAMLDADSDGFICNYYSPYSQGAYQGNTKWFIGSINATQADYNSYGSRGYFGSSSSQNHWNMWNKLQTLGYKVEGVLPYYCTAAGPEALQIFYTTKKPPTGTHDKIDTSKTGGGGS